MKIKTSSQLDVKRGVVSLSYKGHYVSLAKWGDEPWEEELFVFTEESTKNLYTDNVTVEGIIRAAKFIDAKFTDEKDIQNANIDSKLSSI
jgi:hypothetical protein